MYARITVKRGYVSLATSSPTAAVVRAVPAVHMNCG